MHSLHAKLLVCKANAENPGELANAMSLRVSTSFKPSGRANRMEASLFRDPGCQLESIWVVVKIMEHFWIPIIIQHLIFRVPKKGP